MPSHLRATPRRPQADRAVWHSPHPAGRSGPSASSADPPPSPRPQSLPFRPSGALQVRPPAGPAISVHRLTGSPPAPSPTCAPPWRRQAVGAARHCRPQDARSGPSASFAGRRPSPHPTPTPFRPGGAPRLRRPAGSAAPLYRLPGARFARPVYFAGRPLSPPRTTPPFRFAVATPQYRRGGCAVPLSPLPNRQSELPVSFAGRPLSLPAIA